MPEIDQFTALSKALTGAPALDPGLAAAYLQRLKTVYGGALTALIDAASHITNGDYGPIINDAALRPVVTQVISVWLTGEFAGPPTTDSQGRPKNGKPDTPTQAQFYDGMLWEIIHAHPPSRSTEDYGYWASPPRP